MKRAFPQKTELVSLSAEGDDTTASQSKQVPSEVNRRACTSAAMIGLAISMGASSILMPQQNDGAVAAEPIATEPTITTAALTFEVATLSSTPEVESADTTFQVLESSVAEHTVQEGQTLWRLAKLYRVNVAAIAAANGISSNSVLRVGQVLKIPSSSEAPRAYSIEANAPTLAPSGSSEVNQNQAEQVNQVNTPEVVTSSGEVKTLLKQQQDDALSRLKQKRNELSESLSTLKPAPTIVASAVEPQSDANLAAASNNQTVAAQTSVEPAESDLQKTSISVPETVSITGVPAQVQQPVAINAETTKSPEIPAAVAQPEVGQVETSDGSNTAIHRVHPGETLDKIARLYNVSRADIVAANQIHDPNFIKVNQLLRIPHTQAANAVSQAVSVLPVQGTQAVPSTVVSVTTPSEWSRVETTLPNVTVPTVVASGNSQSATAPDVVVDSQQFPNLQPAYQGVVEVPTVELKGNISEVSTPENVAPVGIGGPTVAAVPIRTTPFPGSEIEPVSKFKPGSGSNPYIQNLKVEILQLRDKYRVDEPGTFGISQTDAPASAIQGSIAALSSQVSNLAPSRQINPEFSPSTYNQTIQSETQPLQSKPVVATSVSKQPVAPTPAKPNSQSELVAVAPLGSESYEPLIQPLVGQMVSPELPPLAADRYLPESVGNFKGFIWPAKGVLTSGYGWRWGRMHKGIDIAGPVGTPIVAAAPGVVVYAGWNSGGYGNLVEVQHPDGTVTRYAHNNRILVHKGQQVAQGEQIAEMGSTGYSTGPHSHFEVHLPGRGAVNPIAYLQR